jgi:glycosyltransferase involved in cell wall biosynthesis
MAKDNLRRTVMPKVAVLLPCYNECITIEKVIRDFRKELPEAEIWVYDNNSSDGSADLALKAGALVRRVRQQGKGHVVRRMFQEVEADVYVMVDSDDTYPADEVHKLMAPILSGEADMVNGDRLSSTYMTENKRKGHNFGNALVCTLIRLLWRTRVNDVMTGYRAFSRHFVKSCPVLAQGFEIETEMTLHTIDKRMSLIEVPIQYRDRPEGSVSKLNTISDGFRVLKTIFNLFRFYRPELFLGL